MLRAFDVSSRNILSSKEDAAQERAYEEVEGGALVPLTEMAAKSAPLPEPKKGRRWLGHGRWKAVGVSMALLDISLF